MHPDKRKSIKIHYLMSGEINFGLFLFSPDRKMFYLPALYTSSAAGNGCKARSKIPSE